MMKFVKVARRCMRVFRDIFGKQIRLTDERLQHIKEFHPELKNQLTKIRETLLHPDRVVRSNSDPEVELHYRYFRVTPVGSKYLCVVVKSLASNYFVLTVYFTDTIKRGELLWLMGRK